MSVFLRLTPVESSVSDNQVSAKKGTNIDTLLENIVLVAEVIFSPAYAVFLCFVLQICIFKFTGELCYGITSIESLFVR